MKKLRKKFLEGGKIHNYVEDPTKAIYDNNLKIDQALIQAAQETELMKTIGSGLIGLGPQLPGSIEGFKQTFNMGTGGKVPVEIEGQEVFETPIGQLFKAKGPSHENGGIDMNLPEGTEIFSKRLMVDGKSMADRKLARENAVKKIEKRSKYNPIEKNTLKRIKLKNEVEELFDMNIMQAAFNAKNEEDRQKAATGIPYLTGKKTYLETSKLDEDKLDNQTITLNPRTGLYEPSDRVLNEPVNKLPLVEYPKSQHKIFSIKGAADLDLHNIASNPMGLKKTTPEEVPTENQNNSQFPFTTGDLLGMLGNAYQAYTNKEAAMSEIATDQPNINPYENFGEDALDANSKAMTYVQQMMDNALRDSGLEANAAQKSGRSMSRSANTARAMDIALSSNKNISDSKIRDVFAQQMMALYGQQAKLENQQDAYVMQGNAQRDANDRADKAARFSTMRDADMGIGKAISGIGANINTAKGRNATGDLLNSMSMFGNYDWKTGKLTASTGLMENMLADGSWKTWKNPNTGLTPKTPEEFKTMVKNLNIKK